MNSADLLPVHVAIIMDGNGRWAKKRRRPRIFGHEAGGNNIRPVVSILADSGVKYVSLYAFSTENWSRPKGEIANLLALLSKRIDQETQAFHEANVRLLHLGRQDRMSQRLKKKVQTAIELTKDNTGLTLCLAFDYGARDEIVNAARRIIDAGIRDDDIDEAMFARYLYRPDIPDPDLVIRTGGERRLSNFLLWQAADTELHFTDALWPDFGRADIDAALAAYADHRRPLDKG